MTDQEMSEYKQYLAGKGFTPEEADEYIAQVSASTPAAAPQVVQEMHPDISEKERLILKNFANSPETALAYLRQEHPDDEITYQKGQYLIRSPGEQDYRVVDPDTGFFSKDFLRDVGDLGYDVGSGVANGVAEALGAAAGAPEGGIGAIPGAMAAGSASSAGLEAMRQKLGQYLGIPQNVNGTDVALSGAVGAVAPWLAGAGGEAGLIKKAAMGTKNTLAPWIGETVSGVPRNAIKTLSSKLPVLEQMNKTGVSDRTDAALQRLVSTLSDLKSRTGEQLGDAISSAGGQVDISSAKAPFRQHIAELEALYKKAPTEANSSKLAEAKTAYKDIFGYTAKAPKRSPRLDPMTLNSIKLPTEIPDLVDPHTAFKLQDELKDYGQLYKLSDGPKPRYSASATTADKQLADKALQGYHAINDQLDQATDGLSSGLKAEYKQILDDQKYLHPLFKDTDTAYKTLANLDKSKRKVMLERLSQIDKKYGLNLRPDADLMEAYSYFGRPELNAISSGGTTSTSRTIPLATVGGLMGGYAGHELGPTNSPGVNSGLGAGLGILLGSLAGSPQAIKTGVKVLYNLEKGGGALKNAGRSAINHLPYAETMQDAVPLGLTTSAGQNAWQYLATPNYLRQAQ